MYKPLLDSHNNEIDVGKFVVMNNSFYEVVGFERKKTDESWKQFLEAKKVIIFEKVRDRGQVRSWKYICPIQELEDRYIVTYSQTKIPAEIQVIIDPQECLFLRLRY